MKLFINSWRWRFVTWVTALVFLALFAYAIVQLYSALTGGGA